MFYEWSWKGLKENPDKEKNKKTTLCKYKEKLMEGTIIKRKQFYHI